MAIDEFPSQYSYDKHVLGEKSMLFVRQEWNSHSWKAIKNTHEFHGFLLDEMRNKTRTKNGRLIIEMAFSHMKRNDTVVEPSFLKMRTVPLMIIHKRMNFVSPLHPRLLQRKSGKLDGSTRTW